MLAAGKLRHRVTIEQPTVTQNPLTGEITEGWSTFASSIPAAIEPLSARDFIQSAAMQSEITTRITIRFITGLKPSMRIISGATIYNIRGILPDKNSGREYITLPCDEVLGPIVVVQIITQPVVLADPDQAGVYFVDLNGNLLVHGTQQVQAT